MITKKDKGSKKRRQKNVSAVQIRYFTNNNTARISRLIYIRFLQFLVHWKENVENYVMVFRAIFEFSKKSGFLETRKSLQIQAPKTHLLIFLFHLYHTESTELNK